MSSPLVKGDRLQASPFFPMIAGTEVIGEVQEAYKSSTKIALTVCGIRLGTLKITARGNGQFDRSIVDE